MGEALPQQPALRHNRDYLLLMTGGVVNSLGSRMSVLAFPLITLAETHSPFAVGLVSGTSMVAMVLIGLPAGALVDRWDRKRVMVIAALCACVAYASVAIVALAGTITVPHLMVAAACSGVVSMFYNPAEAVAIKKVVRGEDLSRAAANNEARSAASGLIGPPLAGVLFSIARGLPMLVDAVTYAVAASCAALVRTPLPAAPKHDREALLPSIRTGLRFLFRHPMLRPLTILAAVCNFAGLGLVVSVTITMQQRGTRAVWIGAVTAAMSLSMLAGSMLAGRISAKFTVGALMVAVPLVGAVGFLGMVFVHEPVALMALMVVATFLLAPLSASITTVITTQTPEAKLGRVMSADGVLSMVLAALAPAVMGLLIGSIGGRSAMLIFVVLLTLSGALALAFPVLRRMPKAPELTSVS